MRTIDDFSRALTEDRTWRIRELSELVRSCNEAIGVRRDALSRAIVPVLYAHWEGYFVLAANSYLTFLSFQRLPLADLRDEFWVLAMRKKYKQSQVVGEINFHRLLMSIRQEREIVFKPGRYERINGKSNLKSEVLESCCLTIGIPTDAFQPYFEFIDKNLIDKRNFIAHGESLRFEYKDVPFYRDSVVELMRIAHDQFENAAITGSYRRM
jgi:hypothetical protein